MGVGGEVLWWGANTSSFGRLLFTCEFYIGKYFIADSVQASNNAEMVRWGEGGVKMTNVRIFYTFVDRTVAILWFVHRASTNYTELFKVSCINRFGHWHSIASLSARLWYVEEHQ